MASWLLGAGYKMLQGWGNPHSHGWMCLSQCLGGGLSTTLMTLNIHYTGIAKCRKFKMYEPETASNGIKATPNFMKI
jgi:hypothetical protein